MKKADTPEHKQLFQVAGWLADPLNNELRRDGQCVKLEPRVMDVLHYLASHADEVVTREELEDHVWAGRIVTYDSLTATIVKLRKAFDVNKLQEPVIKTIPKRGYCLRGPITWVDESELPPPAHDVEIPKQPNRSEPERRQITTLACELFGFPEEAAMSDPEDIHGVLQEFEQKCDDTVRKYGGHIGQLLDNQLLIYFGYPEAHEGGAERALHAALAIHAITQPSRVHIGIHTGTVVIGEMGESSLHERISVVGDTPKFALSLMRAAKAGETLMSAATRQLVSGKFRFGNEQQVAITGTSATIGAVTLFGVDPNAKNIAATQDKRLLPMVGRDEEIGLLLKRWQQSCDGEGQMVMLCADAGVGKSRILIELQDALNRIPHRLIAYYCSPYHTNSSLFPVIQQLESQMDIRRDEDNAETLRKIEAMLRELGLESARYAPVFAELLSVDTARYYPDFDPLPQEIKKQILLSLIHLFGKLTEHEPVLLILEDAHWIDPTTLEFISLLSSELTHQRLMIVASYRPEFDPPWSGYSHATLLRLNRLSQQESRSLVNRVRGDQSLPADVLDQIVTRTDGIPLYIEEVTKSLLGADPNDPRPTEVPASLHDSLMARLDRLKSARHIAQLAATLGRSFSQELLIAVAEDTPAQVDSALQELIDAELIFRRGIAPDYTYEFKHALLQNAAYESLLKRTREQIHRKIAEVLVQQFSHIVRTQPEIVAHHYTLALQPDAAIKYWITAGQRASEHSANLEVIAHVKNGMALLAHISDMAVRNQYELQLLLILGPALLATKGLGARDAEEVYVHAQKLCREEGATADLFTVTWGLWLLRQKHGRLADARDFSNELLELAEELQDPEFHLQAHHAAWTTNFRLSDLDACQQHTRDGLKLYNAETHRHHATRFGGHDPGVCAHNHAAMDLWLLGYIDQALEHARLAVELAEQIDHPLSRVLAHVFSCFVAQCCQLPEMVEQHSTAALSLCTSRGIAPECAAQAEVLGGWAQTISGNHRDGIHRIEQGLQTHRYTGVRSHEPFLLNVLSAACLLAGEAEKGLQNVAATMQSIAQTSENPFEAEAIRLHGELLLLTPNPDQQQAMEYFTRAIALARQRNARTLELRATLSLCQQLKQDQKIQQAIEQLSPLYESFTEGLRSVDLQAAASMLKQLTSLSV